MRNQEFRPVVFSLYGDGQRLTEDIRFDAIDFRLGGISSVFLPNFRYASRTYRVELHCTGRNAPFRDWFSFRVTLMGWDSVLIPNTLPVLLYGESYSIPSVTVSGAYPGDDYQWYALLMRVDKGK